MAEKQRVLIVDDDENIAELISLYLMKECYETMIVNDGEEALKVFPEFKPSIVLLDLMLPGIDGYQVCREIRTGSQTPIIMLSAKGEIFDKVLGLELGADDYMIKPFDSKELVARVKAVLRRYQPVSPAVPSSSEQQGDYVEYPDLIVNLTNYSVIYQGHSVEMPPKELELLYFLASSPKDVYKRQPLKHTRPKQIVPPSAPAAKVPFNPQKYLYTKWGTYERPYPYKISLIRGPRTDLKSVKDN